jgi:hypothetical protein
MPAPKELKDERSPRILRDYPNRREEGMKIEI